MVAVSEFPHVTNVIEFSGFKAGHVYECRIIVVHENGGFSAHAADLPGIKSHSDTVEDALNNIADALYCALTQYKAEGKIPWSSITVTGALACEKRILVTLDDPRSDQLDAQVAGEAMSDPREIPYEEIRRKCGLQ